MSDKRSQFIWNMIGLTMNSFNSLFFLIIVNRINGIAEAGIFTFAFSLAALFFVIGIYFSRTYQVTDMSKTTDYDYITHRCLTCLLMILVAIVYSLISGYDNYKMGLIILLCVYRAIEAFSDILYGIMQRNENLDKVGKSLFIKSLLSLVIFTIIDYLTKNLLLSCFAMCIATILIVIFYDRRKIITYSNLTTAINMKRVNRLFVGGFNIFLFTFLCMYITNAPKYVMDGVLDAKYQAIFGIIIMPGTIVSLCAQYLIGPYLNTITTFIQEKQSKKLQNLVMKIAVIISSLGILGGVVAYFIGIPVLQMVYGTSLGGYQFILFLIIIGATLYTLCNLFSTVLIALRKTRVQLFIYIIVTIAAFLISTVMISCFAIYGAGYAYFLTMLILFVMYTIAYLYFYNQFKKEESNNE